MDSLPDQLVELIRSGRKLEAIKILREETGVDLKTAKDAIDKLDADPMFDPISLSDKITDVSDEVKDLAMNGERIAAIKLLMDRTGVDQRDAEIAVDQYVESVEYAPEGGSDVEDEIPDTVKQLAWQGQKIAAIKALRDNSNLDLKASKDVVDLLPVDPSVPQASPQAAVFAIVIAALLLVMGAALAFYFLGAAP